MEEFAKGDHIKWETFGGKRYEGVVTEVERDCIHVKCTDGVERAVDYYFSVGLGGGE